MRKRRAWPAAVVGVLFFMLACRANAAFAGTWQAAVALPALAELHRLTAAMAFPAAELAAVALPAACLGLFAVRRRRAVAALLTVVAGYALLWYPCYWAAPAAPLPDPDAARLEQLCVDLADALDREPPDLLSPAQAAARASVVAGLPRARVKLARCPAWMRALRISGLFVPWTGEAVIDPTAPAALIPFTAVHELMHLRGIADEGEANIAAWRRCDAAGGVFAASARLWALKYALGELEQLDPAACLRVMDRTSGALRSLYRPIPAVTPSPFGRLCSALGIGRAAASYSRLAVWLAVQPAGASIPE